jgi:hypothetical protein
MFHQAAINTILSLKGVTDVPADMVPPWYQPLLSRVSNNLFSDWLAALSSVVSFLNIWVHFQDG